MWSEWLCETESILLARELNADPLLINEGNGRRAAMCADSSAIENSWMATPIYQTDEEFTMVMRTIEIKEIKYEVDKERRGGVISRLEELYRDQLDIFTEGNFGSLGIRVARIWTVSHYKTKPLSGASMGGKSEEVKSRSEKLWIGQRKSFLYKVTT
ncbi:MAG: hypothetical protein C5S48_03960 [Candidatus Methanogaster sp.]|nr:MAG: hypothetical protein C5S48_03960 [ANME-2 cluster archaeon]